MAKPEAVYVRTVNKHVQCYHQTTATLFSNGTPDRYYEGDLGSLWVEYKYLAKIPPLIEVYRSKQQTRLSGLQSAWLIRAHRNNQRIAVIIGSPYGGFILPDLTWQQSILRTVFIQNVKPHAQVAEWIDQQVLTHEDQRQCI